MGEIECAVCCEEVSVKKAIICPYCEHKACISCQKRYLLEAIEEPHCMNCKRGWTQAIMKVLFTQEMVWLLRDHSARLLFEREKQLLPGDLDEAMRLKEIARVKYLWKACKKRTKIYREMIERRKTLQAV